MVIKDYSKITLLISSVIGCIILFFAAKFFNYGFDLSDEGYYLQLMTQSANYSATGTQFGFLYNLLFKLINFNIPLLRLITFIILFILVLLFNYLYLCLLLNNNIIKLNYFNFVISFILTFSLFPLYTLWLPTPNYNILNFKSIVLILIGMLIASNNTIKEKNIYFGWIIIGLGGWLSFLAKPTTAVALGLMVFIWVIVIKPIKYKLLFISVFTSVLLLFLTSLYIDGSISAFIDRYTVLISEDSILGTHGFDKFLSIYLIHLYEYILHKNFILFLLLITCIGYLLSLYSHKKSNIICLITIMICLTSFYLFIITYENFKWYILGAGHLIWAPILGALIQSIVNKSPKTFETDTKSNAAWTIFLALLPIAYGLGSSNSIFATSAFSAFFLLLALLTFLRRFSSLTEYTTRLIILAICSQFLSIGILYTSLANPYRQIKNIWTYNKQISIQTGTEPVYLPDYLASYLSSLHKIAEDNNFRPGDPIIDLSGRIPGVAFAVRGLTPETPWIIAGNPGSQALFSLALKKIPCQDLAKTWLLWDTKPSSEPLNPKALLESGIDPEDVDIIGTLAYPRLLEDNVLEFGRHIIFKPKKPYNELVESCLKARSTLD
ncbi:MAG: hypothetical protein LBP22_11520 [Deltaproteobacteria bacterium]|jgi:hypothetical protein|nr:hypothetical protein [Deltaproteobacteria bacterium]